MAKQRQTCIGSYQGDAVVNDEICVLQSRSSNPYRATSANPTSDQVPTKWGLVSASFRSRKHTHLVHGMQRVSKTTETGAIPPSVTINGYAINAHIAQGVTTDDGIIVLRFSERR